MAERKAVKTKAGRIVVNAADYKLLLDHARLSLECGSVFATKCPHKISEYMAVVSKWFGKHGRRLERLVTLSKVLPPVRA